MALTPFRWLAAAIAGCLVVSVVLLNEATPRHPPLDSERVLGSRADNHGRHAARAADRLRLALLIDSLGLGTTLSVSAPSIRVLTDAAMPAEVKPALDSLAVRALRPVRDSGRVGIDLVFLYDTLSELRGAPLRHTYGTNVDYVLPRRADERCVAIARLAKESVTPRNVAGILRTELAARQLIGPCAFYRAFGIPSPTVDAWLRDRGFAFARERSWNQPSKPLDLVTDIFGTAPSPIESLLGFGTSLPFLIEMSVPAVACATGDLAACDRALLSRPARGGPELWRGNVLPRNYTSLGNEWNYYWGQFGFGRRESSLLSDMVRALGPVRFAQFWTSNESVPVAFEKVSGEPLTRRVTSWVAEQYGPMPPRGPGLTPWSAVMSLVLVALAILVTLRVSARRQLS